MMSLSTIMKNRKNRRASKGKSSRRQGDSLVAESGKAPTDQVVQANRDFAIDLYRQLAKENEGKNLFFERGSDGMTLDYEGNVYLTGDGVRVFSAAGEQIEHIVVDAPWTANVSFCGEDRRTLFITASKGLYSVRTRTRAGTPAK